MVEFLEYSSILHEVKGAMCPGKIKMSDSSIVFKNEKTGKVEQLSSSEIELVNFQKFVQNFGLRIFMKNGTLHRFSGFVGDEAKIADHFKKNYKLDMLEKELSMRGWNWGTVHFNGSVLSFDVEDKTSFEIPLNNVSQCNTGKNEVTIEFHQNDDAPVSLMEMRFHIPAAESVETDPVEAFHDNVMNKASVISISGDAIAIFREIHCLTPRGRYDIKVFQTFFQLHGKTFDYKIPMSTVLRLFLLPHKDNRQMFFVISLDPPIKQGQTRYHFLVLLFQMEDETQIELPFTDEELKEKYEDKLPKELSGPVYEVLGKIMKVIINRKLTGPGTFVGHSGSQAVGCSFKAAAGYLYPLERGFIYVHKPPIHIRFEEIASVNFARGGGSTRSFDFEIELKTGTVHTFNSIEKEEYNKLFDFISSKKLHVKNTGKDKNNYKDDFGDSDNENEPDAYLARVKAEAEERDDDDGEDSEESTDEDFNPNEQESDVAEEYDSNVESSSEEDSEGGGSGSDDSAKQKKKKKKEEKKERKEKRKASSTKSSTKKAKNDSGAPKRPQTAFMLWLNSSREEIKKDFPGISVTEIAKKGGELWKNLADKKDWEAKAVQAKENYLEALKEFKAAGGVVEEGKSSKKKSVSPSKKPAATTAMKGSGFKSKEYIEDSEDSESDDGGEKKASKKKKGSGSEDDKKSRKKAKKSESGSEEEKEKIEDKKSKKKEKEKPKKSGSGSEEEEKEDDKKDDKKNKKKEKPKKSESASEGEEIEAKADKPEDKKSKKEKEKTKKSESASEEDDDKKSKKKSKTTMSEDKADIKNVEDIKKMDKKSEDEEKMEKEEPKIKDVDVVKKKDKKPSSDDDKKKSKKKSDKKKKSSDSESAASESEEEDDEIDDGSD